MKTTIEILSKRHANDPELTNCKVKLTMPESFLVILEWEGEIGNPLTGKLLFTAEDIFEAVDLLRKSSGYDEQKRKEEMQYFHYTGAR